MKKTMILLALIIALMMLTGCGTKGEEEQLNGALDNTNETITCIDGVKIWVSSFKNGYAGGLTSQIIGSCES